MGKIPSYNGVEASAERFVSSVKPSIATLCLPIVTWDALLNDIDIHS